MNKAVKYVLVWALETFLIWVCLLAIFAETNRINGSKFSNTFLNSLISDDKLNPKSNKGSKCESLEQLDASNLYEKFDYTHKNRVVYWKVTEHGYFYCSTDCLSGYVIPHLVSNKQLEAKSNSITSPNSNLFINSLRNISFQLNAVTANSIHQQNSSDMRSHSNIQIKNLTEPTRPAELEKELLRCDPYVNETQYDFLKGIQKRRKLRSSPEPELLYIFDKTGKLELAALRSRLIKMKTQKINAVKLYNRIGNYYRIVGNAFQSIECFRKALHLEPHNSDVLINTARLMLKLKLYDDAIYLTRKSLDYIRTDRSPWLQHFTIGDILKRNGYLDEASLHIEYMLRLKPGYANGVKLLKEINQLQLEYQTIQSDNEENDSEPYLINLLPSYYIRVSFNMIMALSFLVAAVLCGLLGFVFDEDEKKADTKTVKLSAKESDFNYDIHQKKRSTKICGQRIKKY